MYPNETQQKRTFPCQIPIIIFSALALIGYLIGLLNHGSMVRFLFRITPIVLLVLYVIVLYKFSGANFIPAIVFTLNAIIYILLPSIYGTATIIGTLESIFYLLIFPLAIIGAALLFRHKVFIIIPMIFMVVFDLLDIANFADFATRFYEGMDLLVYGLSNFSSFFFNIALVMFGIACRPAEAPAAPAAPQQPYYY